MINRATLIAAVLCGFPAIALARGAVSMRPSMSEDGGYGHLGSSTAQQTTEGKAIHLLKEDGYDQITDVKPAQGGYTAMAVKDGKSMEVLIDPNTGAVTQLH